MSKAITVKVGADIREIEIAIEKANQLIACVEELKEITNSLNVEVKFEQELLK